MKALINSRLLHFLQPNLVSLLESYFMQTLNYQGLKIENSSHKISNDHLVIEAPLQININQSPFTVVMRTPSDDSELIRGLLFAEDIYKKDKPLSLKTIKSNDDGSSIVDVTISEEDLGKGFLNKRSLLSVSSCGICGKQSLDDIKLKDHLKLNSNSFQKEKIHTMFAQLQQKQDVFKHTGGSHAAGIFNESYQLLTIKEDVGRHNAVDKCVGDLLNKNQLKNGKILLVSGRVSYEIVSKAFFAKIPLVIAVSACSSLAVDFAKEFGICLVGFTRNNKMTLYSNPSYLNNSK